MTTAHKPTWKPAVGRSDEGGYQMGGVGSLAFSSKDMPSELTLKERQPGQGIVGHASREVLKAKLLEREHAARKRKSGGGERPSRRRSASH